MLTEKAKPGRKPVQDKKVGITVYIKPSEIMKLGGKTALREILNAYLDKQLKR